jgi:hypothetical protein
MENFGSSVSANSIPRGGRFFTIDVDEEMRPEELEPERNHA